MWHDGTSLRRFAEPQDATWIDTIKAMVDLGLRRVRIGGCYLVYHAQTGEILAPADYYSCVNDLLFQLKESRLLPQGVELSKRGSYWTPKPPDHWSV